MGDEETDGRPKIFFSIRLKISGAKVRRYQGVKKLATYERALIGP